MSIKTNSGASAPPIVRALCNMEDIVATIIVMIAFRFAVICYFLESHRNYFGSPSLFVGIVGILGFLVTHGFDITGSFNIGTAIGFFFLDIYLGLKRPIPKRRRK